MANAVVFISHIYDEKEIAIAFKDLIESSFLGLIDVFVSSDEQSIPLGQKWLDNITDALKKCSVEIILCSPQSIQRPWINFEAGAGWIREIPVIPLYHSGIEPHQLPLPLNLLLAAKAGDLASLQLVFPVLAKAIKAQVPKVDFSGFIAKVKEFEVKYTFWDKCNSAFVQLNKALPGIIDRLRGHQPVPLQLLETQIAWIENVTQFLRENAILQLQRTGMTSWLANGVFHGCSLVPLHRLPAILADPHFDFR